MDFIVSKVAMAVCALLVVMAISGLFAGNGITGGDRGFERILDEFCDLASRAAAGQSSMFWEVPFMTDGESVTMTVHNGTVLVESAYGAAAREPASGLHIWRSDGRALNKSAVSSLDTAAGSLAFDSGSTVEIVSRLVTYENEPRAFVFVHVMD